MRFYETLILIASLLSMCQSNLIYQIRVPIKICFDWGFDWGHIAYQYRSILGSFFSLRH